MPINRPDGSPAKSGTRRVRLIAELAAPVAHLCLCFAVGLDLYQAEGSWAWFLVFLVDYPFSILLLPIANTAGYLLVFAVGGTAWWYALSRTVVYVVLRFAKAIGAQRADAAPRD